MRNNSSSKIPLLLLPPLRNPETAARWREPSLPPHSQCPPGRRTATTVGVPFHHPTSVRMLIKVLKMLNLTHSINCDQDDEDCEVDEVIEAPIICSCGWGPPERCPRHFEVMESRKQMLNLILEQRKRFNLKWPKGQLWSGESCWHFFFITSNNVTVFSHVTIIKYYYYWIEKASSRWHCLLELFELSTDNSCQQTAQ